MWIPLTCDSAPGGLPAGAARVFSSAVSTGGRLRSAPDPDFPRRTRTGVADDSASAAADLDGESGTTVVAFVGDEGVKMNGDVRPVLIGDGGRLSGAEVNVWGDGSVCSLACGRPRLKAPLVGEGGSPLKTGLVGELDRASDWSG